MNNSLRDSLVDKSVTKDLFLSKRRVRGASPSAAPDDYIIQQELTDTAALLAGKLELLKRQVVTSNARNFLQAALPPAANYPEGTLVWVSDYNHFLIVSGGVWVRILPNRYIQWFLFAPDPVAGWQICDGSTGVSYLKSDGTLGTVTVPNVPFYARADSAYDGPTITGAVLPGVDNPATTGSGTANIGVNSAFTPNVALTGAASVASHTHTHTDSGHTHTIADPTVTLPGEPIANIGFIAYVRL